MVENCVVVVGDFVYFEIAGYFDIMTTCWLYLVKMPEMVIYVVVVVVVVVAEMEIDVDKNYLAVYLLISLAPAGHNLKTTFYKDLRYSFCRAHAAELR